ncbi:MAG: low affinity iron permease family protein [Chitinophagales bacterium]|nr:low affinity iron permease family protein [Chitinophagales bacterium]
MKKKQPHKITGFFDSFSAKVTKATGRPSAFLTALLIVIIWAATGPIFKFSDTWQLVINTSTTIITFLMVFIIQQSQNKDTMALQLKLNELIASDTGSSNRLIDIEDLTEDELQALKKFYILLAKKSAKENDIHTSHSLGEAETRHRVKQQKTASPKRKEQQ